MNRNTRTIRIEWGDCDPAGIIFNPRYFEIFDASTGALFERALGMKKREILAAYAGAGFPVVSTSADFHKPIQYGDDIVVESTITFGRSSFQIRHRVTRDGELCAEGLETRVWVTRDATGKMKAAPIPDSIREKFGLTPE